MKTTSISDIRMEINQLDRDEIIAICLKLAKFSVANKELLSYLLFYVGLEESFVSEIKSDIDENFDDLNIEMPIWQRKPFGKFSEKLKNMPITPHLKKLKFNYESTFVKSTNS